jgi:hypothetical protein
MKIEKYNDTEDQQGNLSLWYSPSGTGKTSTLLQTCEDPLIYLTAEDRSIKTTLAAIGRPKVRIKIGKYKGFNDFLETLSDENLYKGAKSIIVDSLTHIMNVHLQDELLQESFDALDSKKAIEKELIMRAKMSLENYGAMAVQMKRMMSLLSHLTQLGIDIHCTARLESTPKWDRSLAAAPALSGKEFARDFVGFFDFIGLLSDNLDADGSVKYPPLVSCQTDGSYLAKWTGMIPSSGVIKKPFNVQKLLEVAHGGNKKKGGPEPAREEKTEIAAEV